MEFGVERTSLEENYLPFRANDRGNRCAGMRFLYAGCLGVSLSGSDLVHQRTVKECFPDLLAPSIRTEYRPRPTKEKTK